MSWQFVDFFFVLSGFVIAASYRARIEAGYPLRAFMLLRFGRIYPLHLATLLALIVVECCVAMGGVAINHAPFTGIHSVASIFANIGLMQGFGFGHGPTWNYPSWSISVEFWTYLLFALTLRWSGRRLNGVLIVVAIGCGAILAATLDTIETTYNLALIRSILGFAVGVLAFVVWQRVERRSDGWARATVIEIATAAAVIAFVIVAGSTPWNLVGPMVFAVAIVIFADARGLVSRLLTTGSCLFLGRISFGIYMVHALILNVVVAAVRIVAARTGLALTSVRLDADGQPVTLLGATAVQGTVAVVALLVIIVAAAWAANIAVEQPGQRWARGIAGRFTARRTL